MMYCVTAKCLRKTNVKDVQTEGNYGKNQPFLKYEMIYRSHSSSIVDFCFTQDFFHIVVMTESDINVVDPFNNNEVYRFSTLPCPQKKLLLPPQFSMFEQENRLIAVDIITGMPIQTLEISSPFKILGTVRKED